MRTQDAISFDKLRGGFYTPESLVRICLDRIVSLNGHKEELAILEPSLGDGAFLRGVVTHPLAAHVQKFVGLEIASSEADKARAVARQAPFQTSVHNVSAIEWSCKSSQLFDVVVGNPPFVRYQFISDEDVRSAQKLGERLGVSFAGVSNLWVPVLTGALSRLGPEGLFAVVVPAELFTGVSAGTVREWLLTHFTDLQVDMFQPGSFPGVLQEVIVLSGARLATTRASGAKLRRMRFTEHATGSSAGSWSHRVPVGKGNWTRYLLEADQLDALAEALALPDVRRFCHVAKLEVAIVTGANEYFSVTDAEANVYDLIPWVDPLLPRMRHARGLIYKKQDHKDTVAGGARAWLLNFSENRPNPTGSPGANRYLHFGEQRELHRRYKTSIRTPWYRVPHVRAGRLMMSKRSHRFPRLVRNQAGVLTTDTIYRGWMLPGYEGLESAVVAGFHNSLTLLTAELEGRSFGGGVLELVPSEIARLSVPVLQAMGDELPGMDALARVWTAEGEEDCLIEATDKLLCSLVPGYSEYLSRLCDARETLARRRLNRN